MQRSPKLVFFFHEAHLLVDDAPKVLLDKVKQVVRLIRSKGVGVYFVSESPVDIPEDVMGQLGNRVQHALRAFTPKDRKALRAVAETFRPNRISMRSMCCLNSKWAKLWPPRLNIRVYRALFSARSTAAYITYGPLKRMERREHLQISELADTYRYPVDREPAYEVLQARAEQTRENVKRAPSKRRRDERQGVEVQTSCAPERQHVGSVCQKRFALGWLINQSAGGQGLVSLVV